MNRPIIVNLQSIEHRYDRYDYVLKNISFSLKAGEFVALVAPSGSGKSTLLSILGLLMNPTGGAITIAGQDMEGVSDTIRAKIRRKYIGFIFQDHCLLPDLTVLENLRIAYVVRYGKMQNDDFFLSSLEEVGLSQVAYQRPDTLSRGEKQRVAVVRTFMGRFDLLIADEPTGSLDKKNADLVFRMLGEAAKNNGSAVIVATHDTRLAQQADAVWTLSDGYLIQEV